LLFNSYEFIFLFLPLTFFLYFYLLKKRFVTPAKGLLVFASLFFYSWWNISYLPLILSSILFNYLLGTLLGQKESSFTFSKKSILTFGVVANLALLGYYKYSDFFLENLNYLIGTEFSLLHLVLPLAISFFTFQQISYLVDSYRGETTEYDFLNYTLFVTFFPQLIAGPIVHHKEMMPQFSSRWNMTKNYKNIALGLFIFSIGLFKKVVIADTFSLWSIAGFDIAESLNFFEAWASSLAYTFQLYFDFSGYTDMAIGVALLFNIKLPINFNSPYKSTSLIQFWERWHITLSRFVNRYIFKPILKLFKTYSFSKGMFSIFISMVIIGLWHGASWMFVFFGLIHGFGIVINYIWRKKIKITLPYFISWFLTFNIVNISIIFFRAKELDDAFKVLKGMVGLSSMGNMNTLLTFGEIDRFQLLYLLFAFFIAFVGFFYENSSSITPQTMKQKRIYLYTFLLLWISILHLNRVSEFLYFNF